MIHASRVYVALWAAIGAAMLSGCGSTPEQPTVSQSLAEAGIKLTDTGAWPSYHGPRKTIAVTKFDATGGFVSRYGGWDVGGGLAAMLASELTRTNRFIVVERADLDSVLREQEMALAGVTANKTPEAGQLMGAQVLVRGSVTEFGEHESGGGVSVGAGFGDLLGAVGPRWSKGTIAIDLRLIDATTGQVLEAHTVRKELKSDSMALDLGTDDVMFGGEVFDKTPLGQATRAAIAEAVAHIVAHMQGVPWKARVASVEGGKVYINAGTNANLSVGDVLHCHRVTRKIVDPDTQQVLGTESLDLGRITLDSVQDRYAVGAFTGSTPPQPGDLLSLSTADADAPEIAATPDAPQP